MHFLLVFLVAVAATWFFWGDDPTELPGYNGETWSTLNERQKEIYANMDDSVRSSLNAKPIERRAYWVSEWEEARTMTCPHGSEINYNLGPRYGFRKCTTKKMKDLRNWATDQLLSNNN